MTQLSVVIPCLNEAQEIARTLDSLSDARRTGVETIVVDGGSTDDTVRIARSRADRVIEAAPGRAFQMNAGAAAAKHPVLLFLHADSRLPPDFDRNVIDGLTATGRGWGRFDVQIDGRHPLLRVVAAMMNVRSRLTSIATGDQALFIRRDIFEDVGGFPEIPLMEDIALSRVLRRRGPALCLPQRVTTSGRRWDHQGFVRTVMLMWRLRYAYWRGADPFELARRYGR